MTKGQIVGTAPEPEPDAEGGKLVRILLVDDDPNWVRQFRMQVATIPGCNYEIRDVSSGLDAKRVLKAEAFDICLVDVVLMGENGIDVIRSLRNMAIPTPAVVISGADSDRDMEIRAVRAGASDLLYKDEMRDVTIRRVLHMAVRRRKAERRMREVAIRDPLTGVYNRRHLNTCINVEIKRITRTGAHFALIMFDVDGLKKLNDLYGHRAGDTMLRGVASACEKCLRVIDCFARYGGDEFAALLPGSDLDSALRVAEKMQQVLASYSDAHLSPGELSASLGVACSNHTAYDGETLLAHADAAMMRAKRAGRNRIEVWAGEPEDSL